MRLEIPAWIFQPCVRIASSTVLFVLVWVPLTAVLVGWFIWQDFFVDHTGALLSPLIGMLLAVPSAALLALFIRVQTGNLKPPPSN